MLTLAILAQLAGAPVAIAAESLPTCSPALEYGTPCIWRSGATRVPSSRDPSRSILVSILTTEPEPIPGTNPASLFVRHGVFRVSLDFGTSCPDSDVYDYLLDFGVSCPLPPPPPPTK